MKILERVRKAFGRKGCRPAPRPVKFNHYRVLSIRKVVFTTDVMAMDPESAKEIALDLLRFRGPCAEHGSYLVCEMDGDQSEYSVTVSEIDDMKPCERREDVAWPEKR